jgi:hypothetical protein
MWADGHDALDDLLVRICETLQITPTQHELAEDRYHTIGAWLEAPGSPLADLAPVIYPQGSLRIGTTVRPLARQEYDLDLVCEFTRLDWRRVPDPIALLDAVEARLRAHETYRSMVERKNRCLRLSYANDFHLDVLPACPDPDSGGTCVVVPDRAAGGWVPSNPRGYATWFDARAISALAEVTKRVEPLPDQEPLRLKPPLKRVVQLLKRWRDGAYRGRPTLAPISIVLTTLAANHCGGASSPARGLSLILDSIVNSLPRDGNRLVVLNPTNPEEDLSERWDAEPGTYAAFVEGVTAFQGAWRRLVREQGLDRLASGLSQLFGEQVTKSVVRSQAEAVEKARADGRLAVRRGTVTLTGISAPSAVPIKRNTFHGR